MTKYEWFKRYVMRSDSRAPTFRKAFELLKGRENNIIETGCVRLADDWGAGMSTFLFGEYTKVFGGHVWTVDISQQNMDVCRQVTAPFAENITYTVGDSLLFLERFHQPIDFLYLDSVDCPIEAEPGNPELIFAQNHQLKEITLAMPKLNEEAIVLLDDNNFVHGGKTALSKKYLESEGWKEILGGQQSLWQRYSI